MTKFRWDKANERLIDPGTVTDVPDVRQAWTPPTSLRQSIDQTVRERESRQRFEVECSRWEKAPATEITCIIRTLIRALEAAPTPLQTETMKEFRLRSNAWSKEREAALRRARGER